MPADPDLKESLCMLFRFEPGATAERAMERVNGPLGVAEIQAACAELVDEGRLTVSGDGWEWVPPPDPVVVAEEALDQVAVAQTALQQIEGMPGPAAAVAKGALDKIGRRPVGAD